MRQILKPYTASYPLARRIMWIVILGSILFTFVIAGVKVYFDYRQELDSLNTRLQQIQVVDAPSLANSLWHFDNKQIDTQLQGMLNLQDIRYLELQAVGGESYKIGNPVPAIAAINQTIRLKFSQNGEVYSLGQLTVTADRRGLQQRVVNSLIGTLLASAIQIFLLAGFIFLVFQRLLTRPLTEIVQYAETLDSENLATPLILQPRQNLLSANELELVALKLNEMRLRLMDDIAEREGMENALRQSERNYREIFNATSEAIFIHDASSGRILQVNASMLRLYGYATAEEVIGLTTDAISSNPPPYTPMDSEQYLQKAITEGPQIFEWLAHKKNGEPFWAEVSLHSSSIGGENRILAVVRDITERKRAEDLLLAQNEALLTQGKALEKAEAETRQLNAELEQRVKDRTLQLTALNQELEMFSYSVAHDLRAPLRHMAGFSQMILDDYGAELNEQVIKWLNRIQESTHSLAEMVDALLALSRVSRNEIHLTPVDMSILAQAIAEDLHQGEPERPVEFVIATNLMIQADRQLLNIVLENLLGNAWKFTAHCQSAHIELGLLPAAEDGREAVYFIRDNGVGFDMKYAGRLFSPFQRLHSASAFSGMGIGLATVKRIFQRHGGRIWAESAVNQGATFYFTFPSSF